MQFSSLVNGGITKMLPYRMGKPIELLQQELGAKNLLRLNSGESPYGVSRKVSKIMADYVDKVPFYLLMLVAIFLSKLSKSVRATLLII